MNTYNCHFKTHIGFTNRMTNDNEYLLVLKTSAAYFHWHNCLNYFLNILTIHFSRFGYTMSTFIFFCSIVNNGENLLDNANYNIKKIISNDCLGIVFV